MPEGTLVPGDENPLADRIRRAIGVGSYDEVRVAFPQFKREEGRLTIFPKNAAFIDRLKTAPEDILRDIGLRPWGDFHLWLFPGEWYDHIPEGYEIWDIVGHKVKFKKGKTDNDIRFGCLAYGIRVKP